MQPTERLDQGNHEATNWEVRPNYATNWEI
jgi:hypothetical protein